MVKLKKTNIAKIAKKLNARKFIFVDSTEFQKLGIKHRPVKSGGPYEDEISGGWIHWQIIESKLIYTILN